MLLYGRNQTQYFKATILQFKISKKRYRAEILHLIEVTQKPKLVAVIHCQGHQNVIPNYSQEQQGRSEAKKVALMPIPGNSMLKKFNNRPLDFSKQ